MSHFTWTSTPGRNGHFGGLFGISGALGRDVDVSAAVCADRTLHTRKISTFSTEMYAFFYVRVFYVCP